MTLNNIWVVAAGAGLIGTGLGDQSVLFLNDLGAKLQQQGRYVAAEHIYRNAMHLCAVTEGPPCSIHPKLLNNLGSLYLQQRRYPEAEVYLRQAVAALRSQPRPLDLASSIANLASLHQDLGRLAEAEAGFDETFRIRKSILGSDETRTLVIAGRLTEILQQRGKLEEAEALSRWYLGVVQSQGLQEETVVARNKLGLILAAQDKFREARAIYMVALAEAEHLSAARQKAVAAILSNLVALLQSQHQYRAAQPLILKAIAIDERDFPDDQAQLARDLGRAGIGAAALHHYEQAEDFLVRAAARAGEDVEVGIIQATLADVCLRRKDLPAATRHYEKAARILIAAWGPSDKRLLTLLQPYAAVLRAQQDYATAARIDADAMRIQVVLALH